MHMDEATSGLTSKPPMDYENPDWESAGRVHDWINYASDDLRKAWPEFSLRQRAIIAASLQDAADLEEWD
jgi:hypothetical protein